jgi:hypothetical protein
MVDAAAWLVNRILCRDIGYRQSVITLPRQLTVGLCFREAASAVVRLCVRSLCAFQPTRSTDPS